MLSPISRASSTPGHVSALGPRKLHNDTSCYVPTENTFVQEGWTIRHTTLSCLNAQDDLVVFVHGTPWSSDVFRPLARALHTTDNYNIVLYDLAGYGQSQQWSAPDTDHREPDTSIMMQGKVLAGLLGHLGLSGKTIKPRVVAHDIAGIVAFRAHLLHCCEYESLCLLDTNCVLPWGDKLYNLVRSSPEVFEEMPEAVFEGALRAIIRSARAGTDMGLAGQGWEDILTRLWLNDSSKSSEEKGNSSALLSPQTSFVRQIKQADDTHTAELLDRDLFGQVKCPVKILWGEEDQWIPRDKMDKLAGMLGDRLKSFVTVPGAGHLIMLDQPGSVTVEVLTWLQLGK